MLKVISMSPFRFNTSVNSVCIGSPWYTPFTEISAFFNILSTMPVVSSFSPAGASMVRLFTVNLLFIS
ncbi:hypothetical protein D3C81_2190550 [compost metagenome]